MPGVSCSIQRDPGLAGRWGCGPSELVAVVAAVATAGGGEASQQSGRAALGTVDTSRYRICEAYYAAGGRPKATLELVWLLYLVGEGGCGVEGLYYI